VSAGKALGSVLVVFAGTAAAHWLLGDSPGGRLLEVVAACAIAYLVFTLAFGRVKVAFLVLVTAVFVALRAADLYLLPVPLLSGRLSWAVVPVVVGALLVVGRRYFFAG
jgi:hypothetical protein